MSKPDIRQSRVVRALLLALAHMAAGIAITWTLALTQTVSGSPLGAATRVTSVRPRKPSRGEGLGWLSITRFSVPGAWFAESYIRPAEGERSTPDDRAPGATTPENLVPSWAFERLTPRRPEVWPIDDSTWTAMIDARGWPLPAL